MFVAITFTKLLNQYVTALVARNCRATYIETACRILAAFTAWSPVSLPDELTPAIVTAYIALLQSTHKDTTVKTTRGVICAWLNWASREELIGHFEWSRRIGRVVVDTAPIACLRPDQAARLLVAVETARHSSELARRRDTAMIYVLLDTGLRKGEVLQLRLEDVDLNRREIHVSELAKGRRSRAAWISEATAGKLRSYLRLRKQRPGEMLWLTRFGTTPSASLLLQAVHRYGRIAGIDNLTVHALRHTAITQMVRLGMGLAAVAAVAGHSQIRTTERYTHLIGDDIRQEAEAHLPVSSYLVASGN